MSGGNISYTDKAQFKKTLYVECIKYNRQLKVNFLAGKQNMTQYRPRTFLACDFSVSLFYAASGGQAPISANNLFFCRFYKDFTHKEDKS